MFGLFRNKKTPPTFAPLVTDMHCHLLPQVDDGSRSLEESMDVMEVMKEVGFEEIRLTPHYAYPRFQNVEADILERCQAFCASVEQRRGERNLPVVRGVTGEYRIDDGFRGCMERGQLLTHHFADASRGSDKGLLLVELSLHQPYMGFEKHIFDLQMEGYDIILAHPERYPYFGIHSEQLMRLKEQGVYFQANILSLDGFYGEDARRKSFDYIEAGWVEFLGTDMHNMIYAQALRHAAANKKIQQLMDKVDFENRNLVGRREMNE